MKIEIGDGARALRYLNELLLHNRSGMQYATQYWFIELREQIVKAQDKAAVKDTWRQIETFPDYEISGGGVVRTREYKIVITPRLDAGGFDFNVFLNRGMFTYEIPVKDILEKTFPEIEEG